MKRLRSSRVKESDFAMTGTTLTTSVSFLRTTMSILFYVSYRVFRHLKSCLTHRFQSVTRGVDEEKTAVDTSIGNEAVSHGCKFFTQISGVLIFYLFCFDKSWSVDRSISYQLGRRRTYLIIGSQQPSLLTLSPYPGVSIMFNFNRTPFSTITNNSP